MAIDYICVFNRHDVRMAKLRNQANLAKQCLVISQAVFINERYFERDPNSFDAVSGFPDLAGSAFAE